MRANYLVFVKTTKMNKDNKYLSAYTCTRCGCGYFNRKNLVDRNIVISCGCIRKWETTLERKTLRWLFKDYINGAKRRNVKFDLDEVHFNNLATGNCYYCNAEPESRNLYNKASSPVNGLDRLDNGIGYTVDNSVSCCGACNAFKSNKTKEIFLNQVEKIYRHTISKVIP